MGNTPSRKALDKAIGALPESEHYFGLENFGNTCYCNSEGTSENKASICSASRATCETEGARCGAGVPSSPVPKLVSEVQSTEPTETPSDVPCDGGVGSSATVAFS